MSCRNFNKDIFNYVKMCHKCSCKVERTRGFSFSRNYKVIIHGRGEVWRRLGLEVGCARASGPTGLKGHGARGEVTTARYVYSKAVIKNVSARVVRRPVIIQLILALLSPTPPDMQYAETPAQQVNLLFLV